jgi:hypothetical protein
MGTQVIVLAALETAPGPLLRQRGFTPRYTELLRSSRLGPSWTWFARNTATPPAIGSRTFAREDYRAFARLLLTRDRLRP